MNKLYQFTNLAHNSCGIEEKYQICTAEKAVRAWEAVQGNIYEVQDANNKYCEVFGEELTFEQRAQLLVQDGVIKVF